jgi:hypothetical protein
MQERLLAPLSVVIVRFSVLAHDPITNGTMTHGRLLDALKYMCEDRLHDAHRSLLFCSFIVEDSEILGDCLVVMLLCNIQRTLVGTVACLQLCALPEQQFDNAAVTSSASQMQGGVAIFVRVVWLWIVSQDLAHFFIPAPKQQCTSRSAPCEYVASNFEEGVMMIAT